MTFPQGSPQAPCPGGAPRRSTPPARVLLVLTLGATALLFTGRGLSKSAAERRRLGDDLRRTGQRLGEVEAALAAARAGIEAGQGSLAGERSAREADARRHRETLDAALAAAEGRRLAGEHAAESRTADALTRVRAVEEERDRLVTDLRALRESIRVESALGTTKLEDAARALGALDAERSAMAARLSELEAAAAALKREASAESDFVRDVLAGAAKIEAPSGRVRAAISRFGLAPRWLRHLEPLYGDPVVGDMAVSVAALVAVEPAEVLRSYEAAGLLRGPRGLAAILALAGRVRDRDEASAVLRLMDGGPGPIRDAAFQVAAAAGGVPLRRALDALASSPAADATAVAGWLREISPPASERITVTTALTAAARSRHDAALAPILCTLTALAGAEALPVLSGLLDDEAARPAAAEALRAAQGDADVAAALTAVVLGGDGPARALALAEIRRRLDVPPDLGDDRAAWLDFLSTRRDLDDAHRRLVARREPEAGAAAPVVPAAAVAELTAALGPASGRQAARIARILAGLGIAEGRALLERLLGDADGAVRAAALDECGALRDAAFLDSARRALADADPRVAGAALDLLADLRTPPSEAEIQALLARSDADLESLEGSLLRCLDLVPGETARPLFSGVVAERSCARPVTAVRALLPRLGAADEPFVRSLVDAADTGVRREVAAWYADTAPPEASAGLRGLVTDPDALVRVHVARARGRARDPLARGQLLALCRDGSPLVREAALIGLADQENLHILPALRAGFRDPEPAVRNAALIALVRHGFDEYREDLARDMDAPFVAQRTRRILGDGAAAAGDAATAEGRRP